MCDGGLAPFAFSDDAVGFSIKKRTNAVKEYRSGGPVTVMMDPISLQAIYVKFHSNFQLYRM